MTVSSSTNRVSYSGNGSLTTFAYTFKVFDQDDLTVILRASDGTETVQTITTHYTVTNVGNASGGNIEFVTAPSSTETVVIVREQPFTQGLDLVPNDPFPAQSLEESLDKLTFVDQRLNEKIDRALTFSVGDFVTDATLPVKEQRVGKVLAFNETTGNPEAGPSIADTETVANISADIATLADIEDGTVATNAITTASSISTDISTVSGISANVTTVANNDANVTTVADNDADITTVATNISSVNTVATNIADVITVANDLNEAISEVETVANDLNEAVSEIDTVASSIANVDLVGNSITNVNTVAGSVSNVNTVAGDISNVNAVATNQTNINQVAGNATNINAVAADAADIGVVSTNIANVNTVAGISSNVTTVATIQADVTSVAADQADIGTVATNISNVNSVAGNATNINAVAGNATNINAVAADATDIGTVAGISANVTTVAGLSSSVSTLALISSDITTVAGISANVTTVAGDTANIATIATNLNGTDTIGTVAGSISNVNSVGGSISNVNTVATNLSSINDFADKYRIGATDPTTDNDEGDLFYNTTSDTLKVYTGSAWEQGVTAGSGFLPLSGGTMTGALVLNADPTAALGASTKQYVDTQVAGIVDSAPATLDTLNELAAALGDDPNFATTTATNIGTKVSKSGDTMTGALNFGDNVKAQFGAGSDLQIYHDGSNSYVKDNGTGDLYLQGTANVRITNTSGQKMFLGQDGGEAQLYYSGVEKLATTSAGVDITGTLTSDGLTVEGSGTVASFGNTVANNTLEMTRITTSPSYVALNTTSSAASITGGPRLDFKISDADGANATEAARIDASGNLLVGTTTGSDKVTVNGTVSATNFNTTSDATLKTNVETLTGSLDAVKALRGVSYDWIENGNSEVGVIAQEVETVIPDLVSTNDEGIKSVKYGNIVAVLIEAIKEQQEQIDALKEQLNS